MATKIEDRKIYEPETYDENPLPEAILWEDIVDAPSKLSELSPTDGLRLDDVEAEVATGFGDISIQGWMFDGTISALDNDTVSWSAGTLRFKDGTSYSIATGNTGNMTGITYIYFDLAVSTTVLQTTTTAANAVGVNKLLVAVAQNVASGKDATFQAFGGKGGVGVLLTADNIAANSITANEIQTNTITTLNLTAGSITGVTITGGTVRTSSGSTRVEMNGSDNAIYHYDAGNLRTYIMDGFIGFNRPDGIASGAIYGVGTNQIAIDTGGEQFYFDDSSFRPGTNLNTDIGGVGDWFWGGYFGGGIALKEGVSGNNYILLQGPNSLSSNISLTLPDSQGSSGQVLGTIGSGVLDWVDVGTVYAGYVTSGGGEGTPFPSGWSVSNDATGVYTVDHFLGTTAYSVTCTARASTVKNITVSSRSSNSFTVRVANLSDVLENNDFMFTVAMN